ncbi:MAG: phosphoglycerate dehydrogenase [Pseudomonadota bacterium]
MRIAVTSRSFSQHPQLRVELLNRYKNVTFNDWGLALSGDTLIDYLRGHDRAIIGLEVVDAMLLSRVPELKVISKMGVGIDSIDLNALAKYQVALSSTPGANKRSVSELVIAFAILMLRHIFVSHKNLLAGTFKQIKGNQLSEKVVGIIGFGAIGQDLCALLQAFNCRVLVYDVACTEVFCKSHHAQLVSIEELLKNADIVTLHVPLNGSTKNLLNAGRLRLMKKSAILINTARGGLVDEAALQVLLEAGDICGAAFDVFSVEPPENKSLLNLPNFFSTPHIGGGTEEAILAMGVAAIEGLDMAVIPRMSETVVAQ